ncbi:MAG: RidA family protein [Oscillospiraceae bacterium]|nr:RidA family protein [Oscillospiraceae bacterium]
MSKIEEKLAAMGLALPTPPPKGGVYSPAKTFCGGKLVYISGCGPVIDAPVTGKLGVDMTTEEGYVHARNCMLNVLAVLKREIGDLDRVKTLVKLTAFVASGPDYYEHPKVANGGSDLLAELFGDVPTRSAVGMVALPGNIPVEIEGLFEIE